MTLKTFKLSQRDSNIFKGTNINETAHSAYKEIVKDYVLKVSDPNYQQGSGVDYDPVMVLKNQNNNKVNYLVTDLNDDGVDELLIGSQDNYVYVVYTFDGKKAVNLFDNKIPFGLRPGLTILKTEPCKFTGVPVPIFHLKWLTVSIIHVRDR